MNYIASRNMSLIYAVIILLTITGVQKTAKAARQLAVGSASGTLNQTVLLPVSVDDTADLGGVAFTLYYNKDFFEFTGLEKAAVDISNGDEYMVSGSEPAEYTGYTQTDIRDTVFYRTNNNGTIGKVRFAAVSAQGFSNPELFNVKFLIKGGKGTYPVDIRRTITKNTNAGYTTPTFLPPMVGLPAEQANANGFFPAPEYQTDLVDGSITVSAPTYTISGTVVYGSEGGPPAKGSTVILEKSAALKGGYLLGAQATVSSNGTFAFGNNPPGNYRLIVHPYDSGYYRDVSEVVVLDQNLAKNFVLQPASVRNGSILIGTPGNSRVLKGLHVKVVDAQGNVVGLYRVNDNGFFETPPLPSGADYTLFAVYGSLEVNLEDLQSQGQVLYWDPTLQSIAGTITGLESGKRFLVEAESENGSLIKTQSYIAGSPTAYTMTDLVPATDYIVSTATENYPVQYYSNVVDITQATMVDISEGDASDIDFDFAAMAIGTVSGTVAQDGNGVGDMGVYAFNMDSYAMVYGRTDQTGNYSTNVPPGDYVLFVIQGQKTFYYNQSRTTRSEEDATIITVNKGEVLTGLNIDITVSECLCTLSGTVTYAYPEGSPIAGALVKAITNGEIAADFTDQEGAYSIAGLCNGSYRVEMNPLAGNYGLQRANIEIQTDNCDSAAVHFVVDTGHALTGRITAASGQGIPSALLYLTDQNTGTLVGSRMYFSDLQGYYSIGDIEDGIYSLHVSHSDYQSESVSNLAIAGDTTRDMTLSQGAYIYGSVVDGAGSPIKGSTVTAQTTGEIPSYANSDRQGLYGIYGLNASRQYLVTASKTGFQRVFESGISPAAAGTLVDFTLTPPQQVFDLQGTVTSSCEPYTVTGATVIASYSQGSDRPEFFKTTQTDSKGEYAFRDLPQDNAYRIVIIPAGDLQIQTIDGIDGTAGGTITKDVSIPCGDSISGTVTMAVASDVVYVMLYTDTGVFIDYTVADAGGDYSFNGLAGLNYKVAAVAAGNATKWYPNADTIGNAAVVSPGDQGVDITLPES